MQDFKVTKNNFSIILSSAFKPIILCLLSHNLYSRKFLNHRFKKVDPIEFTFEKVQHFNYVEI